MELIFLNLDKISITNMQIKNRFEKQPWSSVQYTSLFFNPAQPFTIVFTLQLIN